MVTSAFPNDGPNLIPVTSVFDDTRLFTRYRVRLTFVEWVMGGVPKDPELIERWIRLRIMGGDEEVTFMLWRTLQDMGVDVPQSASPEEIIQAAKAIVGAIKQGNTFHRFKGELCLKDYHVKAMLKECTNIVYPYQRTDGKGRWGVTRRGARNVLAERIFVETPYISLGRTEPDGVHTQIGHVDTPKGRRATLNYVDYCVQPTIEFVLKSSEDLVTEEQLETILMQAEEIGLGAMRSMSYGRFKVTGFEKV